MGGLFMSLTSTQANIAKVMAAVLAILPLIWIRNHHNAVARAKAAEARTHAASRVVNTTTQPNGEGVMESKQNQKP